MTLFNLADHTIKNEFDKFKNDYQTPKNVGAYMVSLIDPGLKKILEPTPGMGILKNELLKKGYEVTAPDDFFLLKKQKFDAIVMNPPFSSRYAELKNAPPNFMANGMKFGYYILKECMQMSDNIIALMPWFTISDSDARLNFSKNFGLVSITALPRSTFKYARIQTLVLKLKKGYTGKSEFIVFKNLK